MIGKNGNGVEVSKVQRIQKILQAFYIGYTIDGRVRSGVM